MVFSVGKLLFFERWESAGLFLPVLCARGWEDKTGKKSFAPRWKKQVLGGGGKKPLERWGALDGWDANNSAKRSYFKKITRKPLDYSLAPMAVIPCLMDSGKMEAKKARAICFASSLSFGSLLNI